MKVLPCGDRAILLDCQDLTEAQRWYGVLEQTGDVVLGARTVLVRGDPAKLRALVDRTEPPESIADTHHEVCIEIPTVYDGEDLDGVSELTGLSRLEVIAAHTGCEWTVAFGGFAPGFAYLSDGDDRLDVPRRSSPRAQIEVGSVGLAGGFSGVYPRESPGGWQIIGHTDLAMWDIDRDPPALLRVGARVRFVEVS